MVLYSIDKSGLKLGKTAQKHLLASDPSIMKGESSSKTSIQLTKETFVDLFLGRDSGYDYLIDYVTERNLNFFVVSHPETTYSCTDKINMLNRTRCSKRMNIFWRNAIEKLFPDRDLRPTERWQLKDTVKAVYLQDQNSHQIYVLNIPGKTSETKVSLDSLVEVLPGLSAPTIHKRLELFPTATQLIWGEGVEGSLSPFAPLNQFDKLDAFFFDADHLRRYDRREHPIHLEKAIPVTVPVETALRLRQDFGNGNIARLFFELNGKSSTESLHSLVHGSTGAKSSDKIISNVYGILLDDNGRYIANPHSLQRSQKGSGNEIQLHLHTLIDEYGPDKLDDISICFQRLSLPEGIYYEQQISYENLQRLRYIETENLADGQQSYIRTMPSISSADNKDISFIRRPITEGDYRQEFTTPSASDRIVTLKFDYAPSHMFSAWISYKQIFQCLHENFPGKVFPANIDYHAKIDLVD